MSYNQNKAMTLIEVLIVTSLISVVSIALYNGLSNGLKIWEYSRRLAVEEDVSVFFEKLSVDLRNAVFMSNMNFDGDFQSIAFPTLVSEIEGENRNQRMVRQIGKVFYGFDISGKRIIRKQADYGQALTGDFDNIRTLVTQVTGLKLGYVYLSDGQEIFSEKVLGTMPMAVEVEVSFLENNQKRTLKRTVEIPISQ